MSKNEKKQFFLYCFCGGCGIFSDYSFYYLLLKNDLDYNLANIFSYFLGTIISFWLNRRITFILQDSIRKRLIYFLGVASIGFVASSFCLWLFVKIFYFDPIFSKVIVIPIIVFIQFSLNRTFSFAPISKQKNDHKV